MSDTETDSKETIAVLIQRFKARRTYQDLANESGVGLGKARWTQLGNPTFSQTSLPRPDSIPVIARVLRVDERRVWLAFGRTFNLDVDMKESALLARMVAHTAVLTDKQVDLVIAFVAELIDLQRAIEEANAKPAPVVRQLRAARKTTGTEKRGPRGGARGK